MSRFKNYLDYRAEIVKRWTEDTTKEWELMSVGKKQELLAMSLPVLLNLMFLRGYTPRIGEVERARPLPHGHPNSLHHRRLAVDLHLVRDGYYMQETEDHAAFGEFWETLSPIHAWGGHFDDGNHYSIRHGAMR